MLKVRKQPSKLGMRKLFGRIPRKLLEVEKQFECQRCVFFYNQSICLNSVWKTNTYFVNFSGPMLIHFPVNLCLKNI